MAAWKTSAKKKRKLLAGEPSAALAALVADPSAAEVPLLVAAREAALDALGFELNPAQLVEAATRTHALSDRARLSVLQTERAEPACAKGCSWCCHHKVGVTVPEVVAITHYLEAQPEQREVVRKKAARLAQDPRILSDAEKPRARIPCALLSDDGSCGVYEVRPIPCRGWLSTDVRSCIAHLDAAAEPRFVLGAARSGRLVQQGLIKAMDDIARYPFLVELTLGLHIALNVPTAVERWLAGEPVFDGASAARVEEG